MTLSGYRLYIGILLFLAIGLTVGWNASLHYYKIQNVEIHQNQAGYIFTNPLLACDLADGRINLELPSAKKAVEAVIATSKSKGEVLSASVYFRDLNAGKWFGIGESDRFKPSSLLKVPLSIAYFRQYESTPELFTRSIKYEKPNQTLLDYKVSVPPEQEVEVGKTYTIPELIDRMLIYSDNQAAALLTDLVPKKLISTTFLDFNVQDPLNPSNDGQTTIREYSSFFRTLFNASYLNRKDSETLLSILSKTKYNDGLVAGTPPGVKIAHKFGEGSDADGNRELHDCGIVYLDTKPYLLCVMTKGHDIAGLQTTIQNISKTIYDLNSAALRKARY